MNCVWSGHQAIFVAKLVLPLPFWLIYTLLQLKVNEIVSCFLYFQLIGLFPSRTKYPLTDLLESQQEAQSESQKVWTAQSGSLDRYTLRVRSCFEYTSKFLSMNFRLFCIHFNLGKCYVTRLARYIKLDKKIVIDHKINLSRIKNFILKMH